MKKQYLVLTAAVLLIIGSCSSSSSKDDQAKSSESSVLEDVGAKEKASGAEKEHYAKMLTKEDFLAKVMDYEKNKEEWIFEGDKPCLIDFYADWCAPCRTTSPILEELAKEYDGKINVYKIDTEAEKELAMLFGIKSIPSFLFVPMEGKPTMSSGIARTKEETRQMFVDQIEKLLL
ncbi:MAG TPA: thiol reductase thioredoxin [Bacteroides sp.]|nr:thiol reductase thioredoxin [Bacteroides sp.]